jgi:hypothetical protein
LRRRQIAGRQIQYALRGDQVRVGREQVRAVDGEQGLALLHLVADPGEQIDDLALIRGEDLDGHFLVEVDAADGGFFDRKKIVSHAHDLDRGQLLVAEFHARDAGRGHGPYRRRIVSLSLCVGARRLET